MLAYEALIDENELEAYEALFIESNPLGPYTLDELTHDAVPTVNEPVAK